MPLTKRIDRKNRKIRASGELRLGANTSSGGYSIGLTGNETSLGSAQYFTSAATKPWVKIYTSYQFYAFDGLGTRSLWSGGLLIIQSNSVEGVSSNKNTKMDLKSTYSNGSNIQTLDVIRNFYFRDTGAPNTYGHSSMASSYNPDGYNWTTTFTNEHGNFSYSAAYGLPWFNEIIDATLDNAGINIPSQYDIVRRIGYTRGIYNYGQNHSTGMEWSNGNDAFGSWASGSDGNVGGIKVEQCFWIKDDLGDSSTSLFYLNGYYGSFCLGIVRDLQPGGYTESPLDLFDYVVVNDTVVFEKEAADQHNAEPDTLILTGDSRAGLMWTITADDYTKLSTHHSNNRFKIEFFKKGTTASEVVDKSLGYTYGKTNNANTQVNFSSFHRTKDKLFADPNAAARKKLEANTASKDHLQYLDTVSAIPTSGQIKMSDFYGTSKPLWAIEMRVGRRGSASCGKSSCTYTYYYGWWGPPVLDSTSTITLRGTPSDVSPGFIAADSQGDMGLRMSSIQMREYWNDIHIDLKDEMIVGKTFSRIGIIDKGSNTLIASGPLTIGYTFPTHTSAMKEDNSRRLSSGALTWANGYSPVQLYNNDRTIIVVIS